MGPWTGKATWVVNFGCGSAFHSTLETFRFQALPVVSAVRGVRARGLLQLETQIQVSCVLSCGGS